MKWYLACCDDNGRCFGFLRKDHTVSRDPDSEMEDLLSFPRKKDASEIILQVNLGYLLLPNGADYRIAAVKA